MNTAPNTMKLLKNRADLLRRQHGTRQPSTTCPVFIPGTLQQELATNTAIRWGLTVLIIIGLTMASAWGSDESAWPMLFIFVVIGVWFAMTASDTRTAQQIPKITALLEHDLDAAENLLAQTIRRKQMPRSVRLLLYHRLAVLRMRQDRFAETAAICQEVLAQKPHPQNYSAPNTATIKLLRIDTIWTHHDSNGALHAPLLLMLVEACLRCKDLSGAYAGLQQLHQRRLRLLDLLQLLALQTRYEIATNQPTALQRIDKKISLAELMPAAQCGEMHAMLAAAAARNHRTTLADWLGRRAELLCTPEQLGALGVTKSANNTA